MLDSYDVLGAYRMSTKGIFFIEVGEDSNNPFQSFITGA